MSVLIVGQQHPTLLDVTCCFRLHTLSHVVAQCLKPVKLATCKRKEQLPTFSNIRSCWVRFHVALEKKDSSWLHNHTHKHTQIISRSFQNRLTSLLQLCFSIDLSVSGKLKHPLQKSKRPPWKPKLRLLTYSKQKEESCLFLLQDV